MLYLTERLPKANYVKTTNKKNQSFTKKISDLPEIIRVPKKKKKENAISENKENEAPAEKSSHAENTEIKEEKKSSENSPEKKSKVERSDDHSPKKVEKVEEEKIISEEKPKPKKIKKTESPKLVIDNSDPSSYRRQSSDNSLNDIYEKKSQLPSIKVQNNKKDDYEYQIKVENVKKEKKYNHSLERDYKHKINEIALSGSGSSGNIHGSNNKLIKILPFVYNEHISNVYSKNQPSTINKHDKKAYAKGYVNPKKINLDNSLNNGKLPVIPNRKLSPIRKQIIKS